MKGGLILISENYKYALCLSGTELVVMTKFAIRWHLQHRCYLVHVFSSSELETITRLKTEERKLER